ncbi:uncharacterized protein LOC127288358 [Leptopilina boulardi]|uniref:uncharacterized protein LOC127288358 n=1 Tax=Leptopilina boulardi TaxID=63433 RepID=UPI0021F69B56|nr:uncharacterized protein LOC127288358 [Leptopilina boulardi]
MDTFILTSPIAIVHLIPIFNYINLLSDFLFIEHKLELYNQYKQIPIINALYEYFEENHHNKTMQLKLIRYLLQGSDLYGEEDNENVDEIFVNTMFDYIISSLVFDKYGNIYGFLADTVRKVENLQLDYILKIVKEKLKNATFDNEYGPNSVLTELAVNRIYKDIILPMFPKPKINLSVLSLDYIFAQAGSTYFRLGTINNSYYSNDESKKFRYSHENLFDEYLIIGNVIWNLLQEKKIDSLSLRVFALPALLYYTTTEDKLKNEVIRNIMFNPHHWEKAFFNFNNYVADAFEQIEIQLMNDYTYNIHLGFSNFQSRAVIAKSVKNSNCSSLSKQEEIKISSSVQRINRIKCQTEFNQDYINDLYNDQVFTLGEIYGNYDLGITKQCFNESLIDDFHNVTIKLIVTNTELVNNDFNNLQYLSYDLLQFYYTYNKTSEYYALIRKNYTVTLIKEADDPELFQQLIGPSLEDIIRFGKSIILKFADEEANKFYEELMKYKKERFKTYLTLFNYSLKNNKWWKEFGLSLVPFYPCLSKIANYYNDEENLCEKENVKFLNNFSDDISSHLTDFNTQSLLSFFGTTIKTIFIKDVILEIVNGLTVSNNSSELSIEHELNIIKFYEQVSLHLEEPKFVTISINQESIDLLTIIVHNLRKKINYNFISVNYMISNIVLLKCSIVNDIGRVGENRSRNLFVNALNRKTGFGYKFINIYDSVSTSLRTDFDLKEKIFVTLVFDFPENRKKYTKLNNVSFEVEPNYILYEINNQLTRKDARRRFNGIEINQVNEKCAHNEYLEITNLSKDCPRYLLFIKHLLMKERAVQLLKNNVIIDEQHSASEREIRNQLKKYIFPDDSTFLFIFVSKWIYYKRFDKFEESDWSRSCKIENPDLLNKLRYELVLDKIDLPIPVGRRRINLIYTYKDRCRIEEGTSIDNVIRDFNDQKAGFSVTFEDYYALRNFVTSGYTRISGDTPEAKRMKLALYKLAIRQSDDLRHEFEGTLFLVESKPYDIINREIFVGNRLVFHKFTLTSTSEESAMRYLAKEAFGFRNILYEIKFTDPYFRANIKIKINDFDPERKVILLPSEFKIKEIHIAKSEDMGHFLRVSLSVLYDNIGKHEHYKNIMREITKINL